jgi:hypothetical protein
MFTVDVCMLIFSFIHVGESEKKEGDRKDDKKVDKEDDSHVVTITVPCPASRAGCLIGSKGTYLHQQM